MKNFIYILSVVFLVSCASDETLEPSVINLAPSIPSLVKPNNNLLCISSDLDFEWTPSTDFEGEEISYFYQVSKDNMFTSIDKSGTLREAQKKLQLDKETAYYWRVQAIDSNGNKSEFSETWNLFTENIALENHLPFMPTLLSPLIDTNTNSQNVLLEWECNDIDGDPLTYNVYLGTSEENMPLMQASIESTNLEIVLENNKSYYWKIDAVDIQNNKTVGQVWTFTNNF